MIFDYLYTYEVFFGLLTGVFFGYVLQRGRLCFNSAIRDTKFFGDNFLMKAVALALGLNAVIFTLMANLDLIKLNPLPFAPLGNIIGGTLFGLGMALAGGCASGVTYRAGEGMTTAWFAAIFYGLFASASKFSFLKPFVSVLRGPVYTVEGDGVFYVSQETGPTVANVLNINPWIPTIIFFGIILWYVFGTKTSERPDSPWSWKKIAIMAAIVSAIGYFTKQTYGLGITGGWVSLLNFVVAGKYIGWSGIFILGIILGAMITAILNKEFKIRMPRRPGVYVQVIAGGALMGIGAVTAGGCNIGHFLTGVPHLAFGSLLTTAFFFVGNWLGYYLLYGRK
ncbi:MULTISPECIES: YeeE/YedE family protein [unclassified Kosmotoga]|uniref:YeeE/YedE family protein n=1 Tax=unclassified Kosmotoga TaxID=2631489 RepID=UPI000B33AE79|nr:MULTISPECIES: YeeE/YedE family protein [unclassified Kosmotoga]MDI3524253.1 uncharacterized protein [Kosmotoga sp.]MDK2953700.1 uncharacterized protein [Kosmotoga sp.]